MVRRNIFTIVMAILLTNVVCVLLLLKEENLFFRKTESESGRGEPVSGYPFEVFENDNFHISDCQQFNKGYVAVGYTASEDRIREEDIKLPLITIYNKDGAAEQTWKLKCDNENIVSYCWNCVAINNNTIVVAGTTRRASKSGPEENVASIVAYDMEGNIIWNITKESNSEYSNFEYVDMEISDEDKIYLCGSAYSLKDSESQVATLAMYDMNGEFINEFNLNKREGLTEEEQRTLASDDIDVVNTFYDVSIDNEILVCGYENYSKIEGENAYSPVKNEVIYSFDRNLDKIHVLKRERTYEL